MWKILRPTLEKGEIAITRDARTRDSGRLRAEFEATGSCSFASPEEKITKLDIKS